MPKDEPSSPITEPNKEILHAEQAKSASNEASASSEDHTDDSTPNLASIRSAGF